MCVCVQIIMHHLHCLLIEFALSLILHELQKLLLLVKFQITLLFRSRAKHSWKTPLYKEMELETKCDERL